MKTSERGLALIKQFEGCKLTAYRCPAGVLTIGYGHTGNVSEGQVITQTYADALLKGDLVRYEQKVGKYPQYGFNQNEFDALVSFAYNVGSIDQLTANGTRSRAVIAEKMLLYNKASGKVLNGLVRRRKTERDLFLEPMKTTITTNPTSCNNDIVTFSFQADGNKLISKNFKVKEFQCKDRSDKILIDVNFVREYLQDIRDYFKAPVTINSAYRTPSYNKKVGGASQSYHMSGQAFDIVVKGHTPQEVARYSDYIGVPGIIQYNTFTHVDSRAVNYHAINSNGAVKTVKEF